MPYRKTVLFSFLTAFAVMAPSLPAMADRAMIACTMEAKLCPDGSSVSRTGPNCEFAPCPGEESSIGGEETTPPESTAPEDENFREGSDGDNDAEMESGRTLKQ